MLPSKRFIQSCARNSFQFSESFWFVYPYSESRGSYHYVSFVRNEFNVESPPSFKNSTSLMVFPIRTFLSSLVICLLSFRNWALALFINSLGLANLYPPKYYYFPGFRGSSSLQCILLELRIVEGCSPCFLWLFRIFL